MRARITDRLRKKKLIVFDLDGTLTETKSPLEQEMAKLLRELLARKPIAVIGGGKYEQFKIQFLQYFRCSPSLLTRLSLFPTTATSFYRYRHGWKKVYRYELSRQERRDIKQAFKEVFDTIGYVPLKKLYGKALEDRKTQVTYSFLGQDVVKLLGGKRGVRMKKEWKRKHNDLKLKVATMMAKRLPNLSVSAAGYTSIDITKKGIDKGYGVRQIEKVLRVPVKDMLFVGDAILPGGNDYAVTKTSIDYVQVSGPKEVERLMRFLLAK